MQRFGQRWGGGGFVGAASWGGSSFRGGGQQHRATVGSAWPPRHPRLRRQWHTHTGRRLSGERKSISSGPRRCTVRTLALKNLEPKRVKAAKEAEAKQEEQDSSLFNSSISIYNYNVKSVLQQLANVKPAVWKGQAGRASAATAQTKGKKRHKLGMLELDKVAYQYYNWRSSTANDIIVFTGIVGLFILAVGALNYAVKHVDLFTSVYQVMQLFFQDGFPDPMDMDEVYEVFAIFVATSGLIFFTILLAMVEQFFMEVFEANVQKGSRVYEYGHVLVLSWMSSALCKNAVARVLKETCAAYRYEGGVTIVVLCDKPKLEMEMLYERVVPSDDRHGSKIIFRQGPPMIPDYLDMVAARTARSTIVVSDASRAAQEADAQALRTAIFLDEMFSSNDDACRGTIVVELKTGVSAQLLRQVCSDFVIPLSTYNLNSIRLARLAQRPVSGFITAAQLDFSGRGQQMVKCFPELTGVAYKDLKFYFPDSTVVGLLNMEAKTCKWNPMDAVVRPGDEVVFLKGIDRPFDEFKPLPVPMRPDLSSTWVDIVSRGSYEDRLAVFETDSAFGLTFDAFDESYLDYSNGDDFEEESDGNPEELAMQAVQPEDIIPGIVNNILTNIDPSWSMDEADEENLAGDVAQSAVAPNSMMTNSVYEDGLEFASIGTAEDQKIRKTEKMKVLIIGWAEDEFMTGAIMEMDKGLAAMPRGTEITLFNQHLARFEEEGGGGNSFLRDISQRLERVSVAYLKGDPLNVQQMQDVPLEEFNTVIILCDKQWMDSDLNPLNGIDSRNPTDMLRMDAMVMTVHVTLNMLLTRKDIKNTVKVITEKVALEGTTRFENPLMLPLGFSFNRKDFAAALLAHIAYEPKMVPILAAAAQTTDIELQDPSIFVAPGESMNYWALMNRVHNSNQLLLGYIDLLKSTDREVDVVINPPADMRRQKIPWSNRQLKLITMGCKVEAPPPQDDRQGKAARTTPSKEMSMAMQLSRGMPKRRRSSVNKAAGGGPPLPNNGNVGLNKAADEAVAARPTSPATTSIPVLDGPDVRKTRAAVEDELKRTTLRVAKKSNKQTQRAMMSGNTAGAVGDDDDDGESTAATVVRVGRQGTSNGASSPSNDERASS